MLKIIIDIHALSSTTIIGTCVKTSSTTGHVDSHPPAGMNAFIGSDALWGAICRYRQHQPRRRDTAEYKKTWMLSTGCSGIFNNSNIQFWRYSFLFRNDSLIFANYIILFQFLSYLKEESRRLPKRFHNQCVNMVESLPPLPKEKRKGKRDKNEGERETRRKKEKRKKENREKKEEKRKRN